MSKASEVFSARVPRYTSYPTAPHFHSGVNAETYQGWLAALTPETPLSVYIHIPFCDTLCWFCGCHTTAVNNYRPVRDYCDLLLKEARLVAAAIGGRNPVRHIHWGGGSPTLLQDADIGRISAAIREHFDVADDAEFAIEIDPRGFNAGMAKALAAAGVTRASIGLQDCDPVVQRAINRVQSDEETICAIEMLKQEGISSVNIDLVYGLPHQTLESWQKTLDFALRLNPDRLAVFGYAHVPGFKKHQALISEAALPNVETRFQMAELACEVFCAHGYVAVGLDHFAKPHDGLAKMARDGSLSRNFQGYTTDTASALIGLGASAIGSWPEGYVQNAPLIPAYRALIDAGQLPIARGVTLTDDDRIRREVIQRLMCDLQVDLNNVMTQFGVTPDFFSDSVGRLSNFIGGGIVSLKSGKLTVSPKWRAATRLVCAVFDAHLPGGTAQHSISV